jgi:hypothetical protein
MTPWEIFQIGQDVKNQRPMLLPLAPIPHRTGKVDVSPCHELTNNFCIEKSREKVQLLTR